MDTPFLSLILAHAKEALDLAKLQETTSQFKHQEEIKVGCCHSRWYPNCVLIWGCCHSRGYPSCVLIYQCKVV